MALYLAPKLAHLLQQMLKGRHLAECKRAHVHCAEEAGIFASQWDNVRGEYFDLNGPSRQALLLRLLDFAFKLLLGNELLLL